MSIPFWCVFISAVLIYVARMPVTTAMKEQGGYNNHLPRQQQAQLTGLGRARGGGASEQFRSLHIVCGGGVDGPHHANGGMAHRLAGDHLCDRASHLPAVLLERSGLAAQPGLAGGFDLFVVADD